jgi:hypothetical protein
MWRPWRRPRRPQSGDGREQAALDALRRTERKSERTEELTLRGELLAEHVRRALGGYR